MAPPAANASVNRGSILLVAGLLAVALGLGTQAFVPPTAWSSADHAGWPTLPPGPTVPGGAPGEANDTGGGPGGGNGTGAGSGSAPANGTGGGSGGSTGGGSGSGSGSSTGTGSGSSSGGGASGGSGSGGGTGTGGSGDGGTGDGGTGGAGGSGSSGSSGTGGTTGGGGTSSGSGGGSGGGGSTGSSSGGGGSTSNGSGPASLPPNAGPPKIPVLELPLTVPVVAGLVVLVVVAVVGVALVGRGFAAGSRSRPGRRGADGVAPGGSGRGEPGESLKDAAQAAGDALGGTGTPRDRIVRGYAVFLRELARRRAVNVTPLTPEEIEARAGEDWPSARWPLRELRAVFEEARYSPHEIPEANVGRARAALGILLARRGPGGRAA